jgi:hypothetical protein
MAWRRSELEDHIATLEKFETLYGEFLVERRNRDHYWSGEEWARRERELRMLAPQAEAAFVAAGAKRWDEGPVRIDLPARILNFRDPGDGVDDEGHWAIHGEIVTHIGSLKGKVRRAEEREQEARRKEIGAEFGDLAEQQANDPYGFWAMSETQLVNWLGNDPTVPGYEHAKQVLEQKRREADRRRNQLDEHRRQQERSGITLEDRLRASVPEEPKPGRLAALWHEPNPWVLVVIGGILAAVIAALLIAKLN